MKRLLITTFYNSPNYGSRLQAIALSKAIEKFGYTTFFVKGFKVTTFILRHPVLLYARICKRITKRKKIDFFNPIPYEVSKERNVRLTRFTEENCREINIDSYSKWKEIMNEKLPFVSGSDIIWNPAFGYPGFYFLDYACIAKLPCIAYASSVGSQSLPRKYNTAYQRYLNHFQAIGVRENATIEMLSKIITTPLTKVIDPTLLLTKEEWDEFADNAQYSVTIDDKYIFCYFVMNDQRYWDYAKKVQDITGLQIVVLPMHYLDEEQPFTIIKDGTPYEFVDLIKNAEFILTDSFHTCAFSLQFKKEFYLLRRERKAEDAKFDEFLNRYGLSDRTIIDKSTFERKTQTDYDLAYQRLESDRAKSVAFLKQALLKCEE